MPQEKNLRAAGDRIEGLLQELGSVADPRVRANAEELVRLLMELYGSALARILEIVDDTGRRMRYLTASRQTISWRACWFFMGCIHSMLKPESRALWIVCVPTSAPMAATSSSSA